MMRTLTSMVVAGAILGVGMGFSGCAGTSNNGAEWGGPVKLMTADAAASLPGRWEGSWQSATGYDQGLAHLIVTSVPAPKDSTTPDKPYFSAWVKMWHYNAVPEEFTVLLSSSPGTDGKINFYGERPLPPVYGISKFDGYIENNRLFLTFTSRSDYGTAELRHLAN